MDILLGFKLHLYKRRPLFVVIGPAVARPFVMRRPLLARDDPIRQILEVVAAVGVFCKQLRETHSRRVQRQIAEFP